MGILTVGIVTKPFQFEGSRRMLIAERGIEELQQAFERRDPTAPPTTLDPAETPDPADPAETPANIPATTPRNASHE